MVKRAVSQFYSKTDQRFLPDRYVIGTCPKCGNPNARGDQCEACTSLLNPTDLLNPRSAISGSVDLEVRHSNHLFFRLDRFSDTLRSWVEEKVDWPRLTRSIALKWLEEGLEERCITRDLEWGIPVPEAELAGKVFYVWFDAPIAYIGVTKEWSDARPQERDWKAWWLDADDVVYTQFMAKDNVPFHTIFWPAVVFGTKEPWTQANQIKSFNWLTYYGGKFSTSQKRGIFLDDALSVAPADCWRYYLLAQSPESDDTSFSWENFAAVINKDLVGIFGNFVNRTLRLTESEFGSVIPADGNLTETEWELEADCTRVLKGYVNHLRNTEFRKAICSLRELWTLGNVYLDRKAPWNLVKADRESAAVVLCTAIHLIRIFAVAALPIIPHSSAKIFEALRLSGLERGGPILETVSLSALEAGRTFEVPEVLFKRLDRAFVDSCSSRFGR